MRLSKFDFDVVHYASIENQATDSLLQLKRTEQDESPLEEDLPRYAIDSHDNLLRSVHAVAHDVDHIQNVPDIYPSDDKAEFASPTTVKIIRDLQHDIFCLTAATKIGQRSCKSTVDEESLLIRKAHTNGAIQIMLPSSFRRRVLMVSHYPSIAGHHGQRRMYETLGRTFYWPQIGADVDCTVRNCTSCAQHNQKYCPSRNMQLISASRSLEFAAVDIVGFFQKTVQGDW